MLRTLLLGLALVGGVAAVGFGWLAWRLHASEQSLLARPTVPGTVVVSRIEQRTRPIASPSATQARQLHWVLDLAYEYRVDGRSYRGTRLSNVVTGRSVDLHPTPGELLEAQQRRYPVGAQVQVRYDPAQPERSLLEVDTSGSRQFALAAAAALLALLAGLAGAWWHAVRS